MWPACWVQQYGPDDREGWFVAQPDEWWFPELEREKERSPAFVHNPNSMISNHARVH